MAKWSWSKLLQLHNVVRLSLGFSTIGFYHTFGTFNYEHIPLDEVDSNLYKHVSANLVPDPNKPTCDYGFIHEPQEPLKEIPTNFDDFLPTGIANGSFSPAHCNPQFSVAILVTYRNRQKQLNIFLPYIHNFLRKQNIHYKIFLIEQRDDKPWNKGTLYNIGARLAMDEQFPCLLLHDVDLLPLDPRNLYACLLQPRHLSASVDQLRHVLPYWYLLGGAASVRADHYKQLNGFSNQFTGWGGEDDNFAFRVLDHKLQILRFPERVSRYVMLRHVKQLEVNPRRKALMRQTVEQQQRDGLNSYKYTAMQVNKYRLYTLIGVRL